MNCRLVLCFLLWASLTFARQHHHGHPTGHRVSSHPHHKAPGHPHKVPQPHPHKAKPHLKPHHKDPKPHTHKDPKSRPKDPKPHAHKDPKPHAHNEPKPHAHKDPKPHAHKEPKPHAHKDPKPHTHKDPEHHKGAHHGHKNPEHHKGAHHDHTRKHHAHHPGHHGHPANPKHHDHDSKQHGHKGDNTDHHKHQVSWLTIGDWGGATYGSGQDKINEYHVARQMAKTAEELDANFVINVGDNFYEHGVESVHDKKWQKDFVEVFHEKSLQIPWYSVLGNHDYGLKPEAQVEYTKVSDRWVMPARYYTQRIKLASDQHATFVFMDSSPCVSKMRSGKGNVCNPHINKECNVTKHILKQDCAKQYRWLKRTVAEIPASDWRIGVAHHPANSIDIRDFVTVFQDDAKFDMYLNGHVHDLGLYTVDGKGTYVQSGAGCKVPVGNTDQHAVFGPVNNGTGAHSHTYVWNQKVAGFTSHTFSTDFTSITTKFTTYKGDVVHKIVTKKGSA